MKNRFILRAVLAAAFMAALGEKTEFSSSNCPITVSPKIKGSCRYSGTQTVLFEPTENWPEATAFTVTVPAGFKSAVSGKALAQNYTFRFTTPVPEVNFVQPRKDEHWISLNPTLYVVFTRPVKMDELSKYIQLSYTAPAEATFSQRLGLSSAKRPDVTKTVPLIVRPISQLEYDKDFSYYNKQNIAVISPLCALEKGTRYTLTLKAGLPAPTGTQGMEKDYNTSFYTYPNLTVLNQVNDGCLPYTPTVDFSTPVRLKELAAASTVEPASAVRKLSEQEGDALGYDVVDSKTGAAYFRTPFAFLNLQPGKTVTVTLSKNLRDI